MIRGCCWSYERLRTVATGMAMVTASFILATTTASAGVIDEVWAGGYAHDISDHDHAKESGTQDVQLEIDTGQPQILRFLGAPHLAGTLALNTDGGTNFGAVSLAWDHNVVGPVYASLQFGIGLSDGVTEPAAGPTGDYDRRNRLLLGSKALFREAAGLNWRVTHHWEVGLQYVHASNGHILASGYNEGINDLGLRLGYRF